MRIEKIAEEYSTPMYLYRESIIKDRFFRLKKAIGEDHQLFYSMKANPLKGLCRMMYRLGAGIEVASKGELMTALAAGVPSDQIIFTSPGKTYAELRFAVEKQIKMINVDSFEEVMMINKLAAETSKIVDISIRVNPEMNANNAKIKMSGVASQFGVEEVDMPIFLDRCKCLDHVNICGFQIYMGTQMLKPEDIERNTDYAIALFLTLAEKYGIKLKTINVGGGFGVKYFDNETDLDMNELQEKLACVFDKYHSELSEIEVIFESGRYLLADAGAFVTKVLYVKESKGIKYVICDGGSNCHSGAAFLGRFVRNNFPLRSIPEGEETEVVNVTGPLCTPLDVIGQKVKVNKYVQPGDYIVVEKSGAYGLTYSPYGFLSHEMPIEVLVKDNDEVLVLREPMDITTILENENLMEDE